MGCTRKREKLPAIMVHSSQKPSLTRPLTAIEVLAQLVPIACGHHIHEVFASTSALLGAHGLGYKAGADVLCFHLISLLGENSDLAL